MPGRSRLPGAHLVWELDAARADFPLTNKAKGALRDWAALSCRSDTPRVELHESFPTMLGTKLTFEHSWQYFAPAQ